MFIYLQATVKHNMSNMNMFVKSVRDILVFLAEILSTVAY